MRFRNLVPMSRAISFLKRKLAVMRLLTRLHSLPIIIDHIVGRGAALLSSRTVIKPELLLVVA